LDLSDGAARVAPPIVEKWLREEVTGVCDAMQADPGRAIPEHKCLPPFAPGKPIG
jgi:hypothetical protein